MKRSTVAMALALLLSISGTALAAVAYTSGQGQGIDPGTALTLARADAVSRCTAQGGTPLEEVYSHITRANLWLASSIWSCQVP
jgi:hypothetical protein